MLTTTSGAGRLAGPAIGLRSHRFRPVRSGPATVYLSGDNASTRTSAQIAQRIPGVDVAVLHAGAARVPGKFRDRLLSMDSSQAAAAAAVLGASVVIPGPLRRAGPLQRRTS